MKKILIVLLIVFSFSAETFAMGGDSCTEIYVEKQRKRAVWAYIITNVGSFMYLQPGNLMAVVYTIVAGSFLGIVWVATRGYGEIVYSLRYAETFSEKEKHPDEYPYFDNRFRKDSRARYDAKWDFGTVEDYGDYCDNQSGFSAFVRKVARKVDDCYFSREFDDREIIDEDDVIKSNDKLSDSRRFRTQIAEILNEMNKKGSALCPLNPKKKGEYIAWTPGTIRTMVAVHLAFQNGDNECVEKLSKVNEEKVNELTGGFYKGVTAD